MQMILFVYNLVMISIFIMGLPIFFILIISLPKWKDSILERFGILKKPLKDKIKNNPNIWFHSASMGEGKSIVLLAKRIKDKFSKYNLVFTTTTLAGKKILKEYFSDSIIFYLPIDIYFFMKPVVKLINPKILIVAETEIWPNLFYLVKKNKGDIIIVNGRISKKSFKWYIKVKKIFSKVLRLVDKFGMRSEEDAKAIKELGAEPNKVIVTGDLKFEIFLINNSKQKEITDLILPRCCRHIIVCGSVHLCEMKILLESFKTILNKFKNLTLIVVPRFLEEVPEMENLIAKYNFKYFKRSNISRNKDKYEIIIVDSLGELSYIYQMANLAFVGGSLSNIGGHNILEPIFFGKPVLFGPYVQNFNEIAGEIKGNSLGFLVRNQEELANKILELLNNKNLLSRISVESKQFLEKRRGVVCKNMEIIEKFLE
ncbi:MAG: glycosyltransferase N-terminal domain-containing protein [Candidatus Firestonebacteria bacterium]